MAILVNTKNHPLHKEIEQERFNIFMDEVAARILGGSFLVVIIALYFFLDTLSKEAFFWLCFSVFTKVSTFFYVKKFSKNRPSELSAHFLRQWRLFSTFLILLWTLLWMTIPFVFMKNITPVDYMAVLIMMILMASMPSVTIAIFPEDFLLFIIPVFIAFTIFIATSDLPQANTMSVITIISSATLGVFILRLHKQQMSAIIQRVELRDAQRKLRAVNQAKEIMMVMMGHDLKQPIEAARLALETSANKTKEELVDNAKLHLNFISENLAEIIHKARQSQTDKLFAIEAISTQKTIQESVDQIEQHLEQLSIDFELALTDKTIETDQTLLGSIIDNILINMIEHANPQTIRIESSQSKETILIKFIAKNCRYNHPLIKKPSGHGVKIITRLSHLLGHKVLWYSDQNGDEITELRL